MILMTCGPDPQVILRCMEAAHLGLNIVRFAYKKRLKSRKSPLFSILHYFSICTILIFKVNIVFYIYVNYSVSPYVCFFHFQPSHSNRPGCFCCPMSHWPEVLAFSYPVRRFKFSLSCFLRSEPGVLNNYPNILIPSHLQLSCCNCLLSSICNTFPLSRHPKEGSR